MKQFLKSLLGILDRLTVKQVGAAFAGVALVAFAISLFNPFEGDDITQIVENLPVHYFQNLPAFFTSSTFYNGQTLVGTYYRPLMTTTFSILYGLFGTATFGYHLFQIGLFAAGSFMLFLVLKRFVRQRYALLLALIFMVHPMNSQIVFSIACLQDALLFFFGISALYILINRQSWRSLIAVAACLLLAMFSKESGLAYPIMAVVYLLIFDRKRLWRFAAVMVLPVVLYLALKSIAVGLLVGNANGAPIDHLPLDTRLLAAPSIIAFYFTTFVFPLFLSTCWYWTETHVSFGGVVLPAILDGAIAAIFITLGVFVKRRATSSMFKAYVFFGAWTVLGILPYLQIAPLDMTACETWFCFSMIGVLAMLGIGLSSLKIRRIKPEWAVLALLIILAAFTGRTIIRGSNYSSQYSLAVHDLAVSKNDYSALNNIAQYMIDHQRYDEAEDYARQSITIFAGLGNYDNLGVAFQQTGRYEQAVAAYQKALTLGSMDFVYENLAQIYLADWQNPDTERFLNKALALYPQDTRLLTYMAILKAVQGDNDSAKTYITRAVAYGQVPQALYVSIMQHQPLTFSIPASKQPLVIR